MKPLKDLFLLIKSLSSGEMRTLRKALSLRDASHELTLLNFYLSSKEGEDEPIRNKMPEATQSDFSGIKKRLEESVLRELIRLHENKTGTTMLNFLLGSTEILESRALFDHAIRIRKKALELAEVSCDWLALLKLKEFEISELKRSKTKDAGSKRTRLYEELRLILASYELELRIRSIYDELYLIYKSQQHSDLITKEARESFQNDLDSLKPAENAHIKIWNAWNNAQWVLYCVSGNYKDAYYISVSNLERWDRFGSWQKVNKKQYFSNLSNMLSMAYVVREFGYFQDTIMKMKALKAETESQRIIQGFETCFYTLMLTLYTRQWEAAKKHAETLEAFIGGEDQLMESKRFSGYYNLMLYYWLTHNPRKALSFIILIYQNCREHRNDIVRAVRVIEVILEWEKVDIADVRILSALQDAQRNQNPDKFMRSALNLLALIRNGSTNKATHKRKLDELTKLADHWRTGTTEILAWIRAQINGTSFADEALKPPVE